jgi:hypothetical protein
MVRQKNELAAGLLLVSFGLLVLAARLIELENLSLDLGLLFLPGLGALFLLQGLLNRNGRLLVPGGILSGIGWGSWLNAGPLSLGAEGLGGGISLMVFGLGFASITVLSAVSTDKTHWWALVPGAILGAIGLAILAGGIFLTLLTALGQLWPLALIAVGLYIIIRHGLLTAGKSKPA